MTTDYIPHPHPRSSNSSSFPPPPATPRGAPSERGGRRLPALLPTITTALSAPRSTQDHLTPASAVPRNTPISSRPRSPLPASTSGASPMVPPRGSPSVVAAYNPQEWPRTVPVSGGYMPHPGQTNRRSGSTRESTGMEGEMPQTPLLLSNLSNRSFLISVKIVGKTSSKRYLSRLC